ncbi:MAG: type II toxin-antitoxin system RelE/ParE family toxin [Acidobacteria bacterium]|nr:type II toxin-antitoxin system RelE/ParE family toxin [Acidobacteriota bacterium]
MHIRIIRNKRNTVICAGSWDSMKDNRKGNSSIRINDQWRICFTWAKDELDPSNVEIVDYH